MFETIQAVAKEILGRLMPEKILGCLTEELLWVLGGGSRITAGLALSRR